MTTALGLLAFLLYITVVIATAAGITWIVVKVSPAKRTDATPKS